MVSKFSSFFTPMGASRAAKFILLCVVLAVVWEARAGGFNLENIEVKNIRPEKSKEKFWGQRYRGWLWFEERYKEPQKDKHNIQITPEEARNELEAMKKEMDDKRDIMMARPSPETLVAYVKAEDVMWEKAMMLDRAYRQAKFRYPEYFDKLEQPHNVHAVKLKRKTDQDSLESSIKDFANKFDLVFFSKGGCVYCREFAPVLKRFSDMYGFKTEEASVDGMLSGFFKGMKMTELASKLGINVTPVVVVVRKDGGKAFELIRGYASISELEEYVGLAIDYVQMQAPRMKGPSKDKNSRIRTQENER